MILFESDSASAAFYFAAEEYIMRELRPAGAALMLWSTNDTVMIGANQVAGAECDMEYMKTAGIELVRRPSGGGAIFTDRGTLQCTVILPCEKWASHADNADGSGCESSGTTAEPPTETTPPASVGVDAGEVAREWLAMPAIEALAAFGAEASLEGRNDITIEGKKVSGLAQHIRQGYICSHCSLLVETDLEKLARALTVDHEKIETKAIASVRARVANIADYIDRATRTVPIVRFREEMLKSYAGRGAFSRRVFSAGETERIEEIMAGRYRSHEWTFGRDPVYTYNNKKRFPGGSIEVFLDVKSGVIRQARITGDFLALRPVAELEARITGTPHRKDALAEALRTADVGSCLGSLGARELLKTLVEE